MCMCWAGIGDVKWQNFRWAQPWNWIRLVGITFASKPRGLHSPARIRPPLGVWKVGHFLLTSREVAGQTVEEGWCEQKETHAIEIWQFIYSYSFGDSLYFISAWCARVHLTRTGGLCGGWIYSRGRSDIWTLKRPITPLRKTKRTRINAIILPLGWGMAYNYI